MILETVCVGDLEVNCYILASGKDKGAIIIDPGADKDKIIKALEKHRLNPAFIVNTHGHYDHIGADDGFNVNPALACKGGVKIYVHKDDGILLKSEELNLSGFLGQAYSVKSPVEVLEDKQSLILDDIEIEVIHTPGHTPGGISLWVKSPVNNIIFTGDTLFRGSIGRTDLSYGDSRQILKSIKERLMVFPDDTKIYPGHGPSSTIGYEKAHNPFL